MSHALQLWAGDIKVAVILHDAADDRWSLLYDATWIASPDAYPLSPALPLAPSEQGYASASVKRFIEHLLPEGRALDVAVAHNGLTKSNIFGLIRSLGAETAGALRFKSQTAETAPDDEPAPREIALPELDERIRNRNSIPLSVWDGKVRMSMAGLQDKLLVYLDQPLSDGGRIFLINGRGHASTHILKPDSLGAMTPHLAINEHFCMSLARNMGLPAAETNLLRTPHPVLMVRRFDRIVHDTHEKRLVERLHIIDTCQACDLPVSHKYERNLGNANEVRNIREGVSFERMFACADLAANKAAARLTMLRWALFQFIIGNSDAHGKNFSFYVRPSGLLEPAEWYDLVSMIQYTGIDTEFAMAYGDVFIHAEVSPFALADFAARCGIDRKLMRREGLRLAKLAASAAAELVNAPVYLAEERPFIEKIAAFVTHQAERLASMTNAAASIKASYL